MSVSDRIKERVDDKPTSEDILTLFSKIEQGGTESFSPARTLVEAAERHPELVAQHHEMLADVIHTVLPPTVRRHLYDVAIATDITSPQALKTIIDAVEADLREGDAATRGYIYQLIQRATANGVRINHDCLIALIEGISASPADTPPEAAMNAYVAIVEQKDPIGNEELSPLIDFMESDFQELSSAAFNALVSIILASEISPETNTEGIRLAIKNHDSHSRSESQASAALEKLS